jgi:hypothetical protein
MNLKNKLNVNLIIPKIQDLILKLEGFQYATSLDLNMDYYHMELTPFSKQLCTIILPFGKYEYQQYQWDYVYVIPLIFSKKNIRTNVRTQVCKSLH